MVALGPGGGHDGGVGDGGAVVAAHGTGHTGGDAHDGQGVVHGEHVLDNGDQDTEGAPAGAGGKGQQAAHGEHDDGQQQLHPGGGGAHKVPDKVLGAQGVGHALQGPGEGEDHDGGDHGLKAVGDAAHHLLKGHRAADEIINNGEHQAEGRAQQQAHGGIGVGEGGDEVDPGPEAAGIDHADDTADYQHRNGEHQVHDGALVLVDLIVHHGIGVGAGEQVSLLNGVSLIPGHRAEVHLHHHQADHHHQSEQGIEVIGDGSDEQVQALAVLGKAGHGGGPGGDGGDDAHGSGGGIDDIGQLHPGDVVLVGDGPHDAAHGEAVEIVVNEDEAAQQDRGQLRPHPGLDILLGPAAKGGGAAGLVHHAHHSAQDDQEDQDAHVIAVGQGGHNAVLKDVEQRPLELEVGIEQTAHQDTDEQGGVDLLGQQGQGDGDHRGQQGQGGVIEVAGGLDIALSSAGGTDKRAAAHLTVFVQAIAAHADAHGTAVGTLDHGGPRLLGWVGGRPGGGGHGQHHHHDQDEAHGPGSSCVHFIFPPKQFWGRAPGTHTRSNKPDNTQRKKIWTLKAPIPQYRRLCPLLLYGVAEKRQDSAPRACDSPQDILPRPRGTAQAGPTPFGGTPSLKKPAAWPNAF